MFKKLPRDWWTKVSPSGQRKAPVGKGQGDARSIRPSLGSSSSLGLSGAIPSDCRIKLVPLATDLAWWYCLGHCTELEKKLLSSPGCFVKCQIGWCQKRWEMNYSVLLTSPTVSDWDWDTGSVRLESAAVASNWTEQCLARELKLQQRCGAKNETPLL